MAAILRIGFHQELLTGYDRMDLIRTQGNGQPLKLIVSIPTSETWMLSAKKEEGTGALIDVLVLEEGPELTVERIKLFEMVEFSRGAEKFRYIQKGKVPPRTQDKRWVVTLQANFGDKTIVEAA